MIFLHHARLVILSQPKTGTTALDNALVGRASIAVSNPPQLKHIQYHKFMTFVAPWIEAQAGLTRREYEVVSVMREPVDWLGSWYRYRSRDALRDAGSKKKEGAYSGNVSFEEFVQEVLKPKRERRAFAHLGSPCGVALTAEGSKRERRVFAQFDSPGDDAETAEGDIGCDRIFPYEDLSGLYELIETRTKKPLEIAKLNISPQGDMTLSDDTRAALKQAWSFAFDLHSSLTRDGALDPRFAGKSGKAGDAIDAG